MAAIIKEGTQVLDMSWEYHTPWHSPSFERVERMNQTLKRKITKLILGTTLPWTICLPIALLRIRTAPRKDIGLSPYEMLIWVILLRTVPRSSHYGAKGPVFQKLHIGSLLNFTFS
jgi:hypothetical protein